MLFYKTLIRFVNPHIFQSYLVTDVNTFINCFHQCRRTVIPLMDHEKHVLYVSVVSINVLGGNSFDAVRKKLPAFLFGEI